MTALESDAALVAAANEAGVETTVGDLHKGWAKSEPYDLILIDGAVEEVPGTIAKQLREGGLLAVAIVDNGISRLVVGRVSGGMLGLRTIADAEVEQLPGFERPRAFTF